MTTSPIWPAGTPIPALPLAAWPEADRAAFPAAFTPNGSPFARKRRHRQGRRPAAAWSADYRANVMKAYGKWLAFLRHDVPEALCEPPAARAREGRVARYLDALILSGVAGSSQAAYITDLLGALRVLAPATDWSWLREVSGALRAAAEPVRDKRGRIVPVRELYALGIHLMDAAVQAPCSTASGRDCRDGLVLALWAARPWRLKNFAAIDIDRHLSISESAVWITFDAEEMKARTQRGWPLPDHLVPYLRAYLDDHRSRLPGACLHRAFWPSSRGGGLSRDRLAAILAARTKAAFGVALHPHAVRYAAATSTALAGASSARTVMALLGHDDPRASHDYYVLAKTVDAQRKATASLTALHQNLAQERSGAARRRGAPRNGSPSSSTAQSPATSAARYS